MLVNLKLKKILSLTVASLMLASGVYAGGPEDQDQRESVSSRKASNLELDDNPSKRQKLSQDQEREEPGALSALESLPQGVWIVLLDYLSPSDLLRMRVASTKLCKLASQLDLWQSKYTHFNLSQSWQNGPEGNSFLNITLNLVIHRIQVELGAYSHPVFRYRPPQPDMIKINMSKLMNIMGDYNVVENIFHYFDSIITRNANGDTLISFLMEHRVKSLSTKGDAEKRLLEFFYFLNGAPFNKNTDLYVAPKSRDPNSLVELISNELALRLQIQGTPEAETLQLYDQLLRNGIYVIKNDFRNAATVYFNAGYFAKAAAYYEVILTGPGVLTQDFGDAGYIYFLLQNYERSAAHYEAILTRPDVVTQDFRNAGAARFHAKQYEKAVVHYEVVLRDPDCTEDDHNEVRRLRLKIQEQG